MHGRGDKSCVGNSLVLGSLRLIPINFILGLAEMFHQRLGRIKVELDKKQIIITVEEVHTWEH